MKTYVLIVSRTFPVKHFRAGEQTRFIQLISEKIKIHTLRGNYELWKKRIDEVNEGKAVLSVRTWLGRPYNSNQLEHFRYDRNSGIGVSKIQYTHLGWFINDVDSDVATETIARNDGLSVADFREWFKGTGLSISDSKGWYNEVGVSNSMAMIHFTDFRY